MVPGRNRKMQESQRSHIFEYVTKFVAHYNSSNRPSICYSTVWLKFSLRAVHRRFFTVCWDLILLAENPSLRVGRDATLPANLSGAPEVIGYLTAYGLRYRISLDQFGRRHWSLRAGVVATG